MNSLRKNQIRSIRCDLLRAVYVGPYHINHQNKEINREMKSRLKWKLLFEFFLELFQVTFDKNLKPKKGLKRVILKGDERKKAKSSP